MMETSDLVYAFQASVSPVVLISGVGLLLLSMTNRLARAVDQSRNIASLRKSSDPNDSRH